MEKWTKILANHPEANFLQSPAWAKVNEAIGHQTVVKFYDGALCLMIIKNAKRGRYIEIPGGPIVDWHNKPLVETIFADIKQVAREHRCVFVRLRPQLPNTPANLQLLRALGTTSAPMHLAAEHTVIIDLKQSEDDLLKNMRRQTRYEVKRGQKINIKVEKSNSEAIFREFHSVQTQTAKLQHFIPPNLQILLAEREAFGDQIAIYVAKTGTNTELKGQKFPPDLPIAYGVIIWNGLEAAYYEAASTELHRTLPGAYALQWQVIKDLKAQGIERYNLWGIAPEGAKHHRYSGVTTFKTGFGGQITNFIPAQDLVINRTKYLKNLIIETIRKKRRHL